MRGHHDVHGEGTDEVKRSETKLTEQAALLRAKAETKKRPPEIPDGNPQPIDNPGRNPGQQEGSPEMPPRPGHGPDRR